MTASQVAEELDTLGELFIEQHRPELWNATRAALGVVASLSLKDRDHCLALVFVGASGQGKSITARMVSPAVEAARNYLIRADDFTPASFVSHAANRSAKDLKDIDLLPRITNKVMVTKELAPLFGGDEKEVRKNFATLTSVLDGNGYEKTSGVHGSRGYSGRYLFNWIGATTPIPDRTYRVMGQLGNRFLFYYIDSQEPTEEDLLKFADGYRSNDTVSTFQQSFNELILRHFKDHPPDSVDPQAIVIPADQQIAIVRYAILIARGRVLIEFNDDGEPEPQEPEGEQRIILLLQMLARGLALSAERSEVTQADLELVHHVALSTLPYKRMKLLRALFNAGGEMSIREVEAKVGISTVTAEKRMTELAATGIAEFIPGDPKANLARRLRLTKRFQWLAGTPL
jgi:hypothetical protein